MTVEPDADVLIRARSAYRHVVEDPQGFQAHVARLVEEARASQHPAALCLALRAQAWSERYQMQHERAKKIVDEAIRIATRHQLDEIRGELLITRGAVNHERGRLQAARRDFANAEKLIAPRAATELSTQRATLLANLGLLSQAAELYEAVLSDETAPGEVRFHCANNLALTHALSGRYSEAFRYFDIAESAARDIGPTMVAYVCEGKAWTTVQSGRIAEGLKLFDEAETLYRDAGLSLAELYTDLADALTDLRLLVEAEAQAARAVEILAPTGAELIVAEAILRVARLSQLTGSFSEAEASAQEATLRFRNQRRHTWSARSQLVAIESRLASGQTSSGDVRRAITAASTLARNGLVSVAVDAYLTSGRVATAAQRPDAAIGAWRRAFELSQGSSLLVRLKGKLAAALAAEALGQASLVRKYTRAGLEDLARHRAAIASTELKALASGHGEELGCIGLTARVGSQPAIKVLEWMERTRAAALSHTDVHESQEVGDDLGELRAAQAELVAARRQTGKEPPALRARLTAIEQRIRRATWTAHASGAAAGSALPIHALRQELGDQVLIEYDLLDGQLIAAVLEARRTRLVRLGSFDRLRAELDSFLFTLRYLAGNPSSVAAPAMADTAHSTIARLHAILLGPLRLTDHPSLVVVPVKELQQVPWSALHSRPVALAPSASMWARSSRAVPPPNSRIVLAAGPELPGAEREVTELAKQIDGATVLVPPDSTVECVTNALDEASLAHLACHCYIRSDNPTFSSLLLSDGYLTVHELDQRADVPHRVILAACNSGNDVTYEGNEVLGFVSTLMGKGSAGVIASSVVVPDHELLPLMRSVHERINGGATLAQALKASQEALDRDDPKAVVAAWAFNAFGAA